MTTRALAPAGLTLPDYVRRALVSGERPILDHGFEASELGLEWWDTTLAEAGLDRFRVSVNPNDNGSKQLTRGELFSLGARIQADSDDDEILNLLWHVLAWGSGTSRRMNRKRVQSFATAGGRDHVALLRIAAQWAQDGDPRAAYSALIAPGRGRIPGLGPAFFSKFLYFAAGDNPECGCLILDARVAENLAAAGWTSLPHRCQGTRESYSYNWFTDTYVSYCELLWRWAAEHNRASSTAARPDEIERALWDGPGQN